MADLSDSELFDSAISGNAVETAEPVAQQQEPAQPRDDAGRFASQQVQPAPAATQPAAEPAPSASEPVANSNGGVPVGAVQAEREKRQEAQRENAELQRRIASLEGQIGLLTQQRQPAQQPQQEQQPASIFEDPDAFLKSQLSPVQQQMQETREMLMELQATQIHGADAVTAAKEAAKTLFNTPEGRALAQKPGNLFDNLVQWHKQQTTLALTGGDPQKWFEAELEKKLADPAFLASAVERARAGATAQPGNRQSPVTNIPPSLSRLPAGGNAPPAGDQSDGALFSSVTSGRRG